MTTLALHVLVQFLPIVAQTSCMLQQDQTTANLDGSVSLQSRVHEKAIILHPCAAWQYLDQCLYAGGGHEYDGG